METPFHERLSFGVRGAVLFTNLLPGASATDASSTTSPPRKITYQSTSTSKRFGGGPTVHFQISRGAALTADLIYRRAGYDSGSRIVEQESDGAEGDFLGSTLDRSRADFWDVPVLFRYYRLASGDGQARFFVTGGIAFRTVTGIRSFRETISQTGLSDTTTLPIEPANRSAQGGVAGVGLHLKDNTGLAFDFEVRYTHWFQRVFESGVVRSSLNQGDVLVGITF